MLDTEYLCEWIISRQMQCEGGYQGRTNKLVDGCYSFWLGASAVLLELYLEKSTLKVKLLNRGIWSTH